MPEPDKCAKWCDLRHEDEEKLLQAHMARIETRLNLADEKVESARLDLERRLETLNELRREVVKDRDLFLRRDVYEMKTTGYDAWCATTNNRITIIETRSVTWTAAIALGFTILQLAFHFWIK